MSVAPDDPAPLFRAIVGLGAVAALILLGGFIAFVYFEPPGNASGATARINGVYHWDRKDQSVDDKSALRFNPTEVPAAVVDWQSIPTDLNVGAHWYDSQGEPFGGVGPAKAASLADQGPVAIDTQGLDHLPPGRFTFAVEEFSGGRVVHVLARTTILVTAA